MCASFTNQTLAQIELFTNNAGGKYQKKVYMLPKRSTRRSRGCISPRSA